MNLRRKRKQSMIPLSAMGDIAFLLLIFFMATTLVTDQRPLELDLPEVASDIQSSPYPLVIYLEREQALSGQAFFFNRLYSFEELPAAVREQAALAPDAVRLYLSVDRDTPFAAMQQGLDALKEAGIRNVVITTRPPEGGR